MRKLNKKESDLLKSFATEALGIATGGLTGASLALKIIELGLKIATAAKAKGVDLERLKAAAKEENRASIYDVLGIIEPPPSS
jgi:hypothetical protein